eukprot:2489392-Lingulodinium_polyedra.AAC.1
MPRAPWAFRTMSMLPVCSQKTKRTSPLGTGTAFVPPLPAPCRTLLKTTCLDSRRKLPTFERVLAWPPTT